MRGAKQITTEQHAIAKRKIWPRLDSSLPELQDTHRTVVGQSRRFDTEWKSFVCLTAGGVIPGAGPGADAAALVGLRDVGRSDGASPNTIKNIEVGRYADDSASFAVIEGRLHKGQGKTLAARIRFCDMMQNQVKRTRPLPPLASFIKLAWLWA
jgi:hypothetical protein